jgi:two-component system, OmpR family, sensor histidine kinase KdpD
MSDFEIENERMRFSGDTAMHYFWAVAACVMTTLIATPLLGVFDLANIVMLFLLTVVIVALRLGQGPAVAAAFLSVLLFDIFFVPPRFSLAVSDTQYLVTFAVMLVVALIIGQLTARLRLRANAALASEKSARALYEMARDLFGAMDGAQVADLASQFIRKHLSASSTVLIPGPLGELVALPSADHAAIVVPPQASIVYQRGEPELFVAEPDAYPLGLCLPLKTSMQVRGVLIVQFLAPANDLAPEHRHLLETVASLMAIAIERTHYVKVAQEALVNAESERLRNSLLSTLSHDLRTPLTILVGLADSLTRARPPLPPRHSQAATVIREHALRMSSLVHNLLDMARLQAGKVKLNKEWQPLEEVIGSSLKCLELPLARHRLVVRLPADLPLLNFDAVLIERVLVNLFENAVKYAPGSEITIDAKRNGNVIEIAVADNGRGLPKGAEETIFALFERGRNETGAGGVGLGLAICRAIVEIHGGRIWAAVDPEGGARFVFSLPVGDPPLISQELMEHSAGKPRE